MVTKANRCTADVDRLQGAEGEQGLTSARGSMAGKEEQEVLPLWIPDLQASFCCPARTSGRFCHHVRSEMMKKNMHGEEEPRNRGRKDGSVGRKRQSRLRESALQASFSQSGLNVWERLRSKSGPRGERPVAFTEREREREGGKRKRERDREREGLHD